VIDPAAPSAGSLSDWLRWLWYRFGYFLTAVFLLFGYGLRIFGKQNVPQRGGLLIIANHQSYLDPPMVGLAMWRPIHYVARRTLFRSRIFAWLIDSLGAFPIDQDSSGADGIKIALRLLKAGKAVLVFPEGARTPNGRIQALKPGVVAILRRAKTPILPVGVAGAFELWPIQRRAPVLAPLILPDRGRVAVVVGKPIDVTPLLQLPPQEIMEILRQELQKVHAQAETVRYKAKSRITCDATSTRQPRC
jgi:1-acyl-sn-glycerol-3-phosphate acyltransferase